MQDIDNWLNQYESKDTQERYKWYTSKILPHVKLSRKHPKKKILNALLDSFGWEGNHRRNAIITMRSLVRFLYGKKHPLLKMKIPKWDRKPQRVPTPEEVGAVFQVIDMNSIIGKRNFTILMVMPDNGLRNAEICNLEWKYIYLEDFNLQALTKGGKWEWKSYSEETAAFLHAWKVESLGYSKCGNVFFGIGGTTPGMPLTPRGLNDIFAAMCKKAGVEKITPHDMRRFFMTYSQKLGAPSRIVQKAAGVSRIEMVEHYSPTISHEDMRGYFPSQLIRAVIKAREGATNTLSQNLEKPHPE